MLFVARGFSLAKNSPVHFQTTWVTPLIISGLPIFIRSPSGVLRFNTPLTAISSIVFHYQLININIRKIIKSR